MRLWRRNRRWPIALDLGTDSIKVLQLASVNSSLTVRAAGRWQFPLSAADNPTQRRELAVAAVRDIIRRGDFRGRRVVTALSAGELSITNVRLPHMSRQELDDAVLWEAKERFEFDVDPDRLKYLNAGKVRSGNEVSDEIIMMAVSEQVIEEHLSLIAAMGLQPERIEAEPVAVFREAERFLRRRADEDAVTVVADVGSVGTRVVVARGRNIVFLKNIDIGGQAFNEAVAAQLNLDITEARDLRTRVMQEHARRLGGAKKTGQDDEDRPARSEVDWTIRDAVRGRIEELARELSLCLRYCSVTFRGLRADEVTLGGGEVYDPAVIELLSENLGVECSPVHPLRGIDVSQVSLGMGRRTPLCEWATCMGLALLDADIAPHAREVSHERRLSA